MMLTLASSNLQLLWLLLKDSQTNLQFKSLQTERDVLICLQDIFASGLFKSKMLQKEISLGVFVWVYWHMPCPLDY